MLQSALLARWLVVLSLFACGFLYAQDEHPRPAPSSAIHDSTVISEIHFYGDNELARQDQTEFEQIYRTDCECADAVKSLGEIVLDLYQQHGYFKAEVQSTAQPLTAAKDHPRVSVDVEIKKGVEYKFGRLDFTGQKIFSAEQLRGLFPVKSEELFNVQRLRDGLDNLDKVYGARGYIDVTPILDTESNDAQGIVNVSIEIDEGPQFRIGTIAFSGGGAQDSNFQQRVLNSLGFRPGDIYEPRLLRTFFDKNHSWLPAGTVEDHVEIARNTREHTVDLYFVFK